MRETEKYMKWRESNRRANYIRPNYTDDMPSEKEFVNWILYGLVIVVVALLILVIYTSIATCHDLEEMEANASDVFSEVYAHTEQQLQYAFTMAKVAEKAGENVEVSVTNLSAIRANMKGCDTPSELDEVNDTLAQMIKNYRKKLSRGKELANDEAYNQLQEDIEKNAEDIVAAKEDYNDIIEEYNNKATGPLRGVMEIFATLEVKELFESPYTVYRYAANLF